MSGPQTPYTSDSNPPRLQLVHSAPETPAPIPWLPSAREHPALRLLFRTPEGILGQCTLSTTISCMADDLAEARAHMVEVLCRHHERLGFEVLAVERLHSSEVELG